MALLCNLAMDLAILFYTTQLAYANLGWHPQVEIMKSGPQLQEIYAVCYSKEFLPQKPSQQ